MISPTGKGIRGSDKWGSGAYGSSRDNGSRIHSGVDFICEPGQNVLCPISSGKIIREAKPYSKGDYSGILIRGKNIEIKMFYLMPIFPMIGQECRKGDYIGIAQDISEKYPGMTPHIHLEIVSLNPGVLINLCDELNVFNEIVVSLWE